MYKLLITTVVLLVIGSLLMADVPTPFIVLADTIPIEGIRLFLAVLGAGG